MKVLARLNRKNVVPEHQTAESERDDSVNSLHP